MTLRAYDSNLRVELVPATADDAPVLENLLELYAHDFSEFHAIELGADGRFGYQHLPLYWSDPGRHAFLAKVEGRLAGLVLVTTGSEITGSETVRDMAEFFVVRRYRRCGVGTDLAQQVWRGFPGRWEVRVKESNLPAQNFWHRAISSFGVETVQPARVEKSGEFWQLFSFESKG